MNPQQSTADLRRQQATECMRESTLFAALDEPQLNQVLNGVRLAQLENGEQLFTRGQEAKEIFLLQSGRIKLALHSPQGQEKIIDLIGPGDSFAEAVLFSRGHRYPVTASALEVSSVWCVAGDNYLSVLSQSTDTAFAVMAQLSKRLHRQVNEIDRLTLHNARFRVAAYLLDQLPAGHRDNTRFTLNVPKHVIAARLSISPETLSRTFAKLEQEGFIQLQRNQVEIGDITAMRALLLN